MFGDKFGFQNLIIKRNISLKSRFGRMSLPEATFAYEYKLYNKSVKRIIQFIKIGGEKNVKNVYCIISIYWKSYLLLYRYNMNIYKYEFNLNSNFFVFIHSNNNELIQKKYCLKKYYVFYNIFI